MLVIIHHHKEFRTEDYVNLVHLTLEFACSPKLCMYVHTYIHLASVVKMSLKTNSKPDGQGYIYMHSIFVMSTLQLEKTEIRNL